MTGILRRPFKFENICTEMSPNLKREHRLTGSMMSSDCGSPKKKRIRAKLDHLTAEQKKARRKEMNRRAAQTTRDRKRLTMEQLIEENRIKDIESARKDKEIEYLKGRIKFLTASGLIPSSTSSPSQLIDSGISEDNSKISATNTESSEMDVLPPPPPQQHNHLNSPSHMVGPTGDNLTLSSRLSDSYIDSIVGGEIDEEQCIDDVLQLEKSVYSETGNDLFGSAESINVFLPRVQETQNQSLSLETSAGWTSIQLILLLLITKVHRLYSAKTRCCFMNMNGSRIERINLCNINSEYGNLYDYLNNNNSCINLRIAAEGIISNKNNIFQQRLIALEFVSGYVYNEPTYLRRKANSRKIPFA